MPGPAWIRTFVSVVGAVGIVACAEPPEKEIHRAEGAIEAARAAGAEQFAAEELGAAAQALANARTAVGDRDYRLALNHALDAFERAQTAAHDAAEHKARLRAAVTEQLAAIDTTAARAAALVARAEAVRLPARQLAEPRAALARAREQVQNARAALEREDYSAAGKMVEGLAEQLQAQVTGLEEALGPRADRRGRQ